jgi:Arc/MetJ-type ribon-helix-helix transcriptional regulator
VEVELTPSQKALIRQAIEAGRLLCEEEAVQAVLSLWEENERRRLEILAAVDEAEESLERGEGRTITTRNGVTQLVTDVKRRGMARLTGGQNLP